MATKATEQDGRTRKRSQPDLSEMEEIKLYNTFLLKIRDECMEKSQKEKEDTKLYKIPKISIPKREIEQAEYRRTSLETMYPQAHPESKSRLVNKKMEEKAKNKKIQTEKPEMKRAQIYYASKTTPIEVPRHKCTECT